MSITEGPVYEDYDKGISIFSGYDADSNQNPLLQSISTDLDRKILNIEQRLKVENYFNLEDGIKNILEKYRDTASTPIINNTFLYRARVGYKEKKRSIALGFETEFHYVPYKNSEISSPPPNLAMSGRVNRAGVSFLYCATDKYTAVAEVRPHPGDRVSLAKLCIKEDVQVYDLSDTKLLYFFESDEALDNYKPLNTLGVLMNKTIPPAERSHYSITQLISDCIRQIGFDGIMFNSTVGAGKNIVLFDRAVIEQVHDAAEVVLIESVKYEYSQEIIVTDEEIYIDS
ncbi:MAG: RES family NAD+ phosphorylase [Cellvibrionales bacterium]|nr:RES family NAD+ phosphorylase [Cellvibrionales bacterium]